MSQPYTPTTDDILRCYMQRGGSEEEFNLWYEAEIAATKQRGAEHHLRLAASELNMHHLTEDLSDDALELGVRFINLIQDRADRIANKEDDDVEHMS